MKLFIAIFMTFLSLASHADTLKNAKKAKAQLSYLLKNKNVSSIGIGACDAYTGEQKTNDFNDFVYCVVVGTYNEAQARTLSKSFPRGTKVHDTFVAVYVSGAMEPQPRIGGGTFSHD